MNNKELHHRFVQLGRERSKISHQLLVLLPEIEKLGIFREYGCDSIYEYAAKFGDGLSSGVVNKVLKVKKDLFKCPALFDAVATQGVHKIAMVAKLATPENEEELVEVVKNMSKPAVQEYSKEKRGKTARKNTKIEMDEDMEFLFLKLKKKLGGSSNKETMKRLLKAMEKQFFPGEKSHKPKESKKITRYIPAHIKKETSKKTNGRCSHQNCNRPIEHFHHQDPYRKSHSHESLTGLCKIHHEFEHSGIRKPFTMTDFLYQQHRQVKT